MIHLPAKRSPTRALVVVAVGLCGLGIGPGRLGGASEVAANGPALDRWIDFQQYRFGLTPPEFEYDAAGPHGPVLSAGRPLWRVYVDPLAPSPKMVLLQAAARAEADHYPFALLRGVQVASPKLAVSLKFVDGSLARSAGLLWQAGDKGHFAAALVNGLDHGVSVWRVREGVFSLIQKAKVPFVETEWNRLEVSVQREGVEVWLNDQLVLKAGPPEPTTPGRVGLVTHADTVALFDDFHLQEGAGRVARRVSGPPSQSPPAVLRIGGARVTDADFKTPRASFATGSRVHWKVPVTDAPGQPVPAATVECALLGPKGSMLATEKAMTGGDGWALFSLVLPPEARPGRHKVVPLSAAREGSGPMQPEVSAGEASTTSFEVR
jgi:hypothetical protein